MGVYPLACMRLRSWVYTHSTAVVMVVMEVMVAMAVVGVHPWGGGDVAGDGGDGCTTTARRWWR
jgi:hypothetical protein